MDNVDVGLFDRDWNNAIYFFLMNADDQIYMRYGGRDSQAAGMKPGDRIAALNGTAVWTFADLQYQFDKVNRRADKMQIAVDRAGQSVELTVALPVRWWWTDLRFRQSSVEPRPYFEDRPLTEAEKQKLGLKLDGFASEVRYVAEFSRTMKSHELKVGDIIYGVDGVERDEAA